MKNTDSILINDYEFKMGKYMSDGWNLFKKGAGNYIGFTIVFFIIVIILSFIPFVNFFLTFIEYVLIAGIFVYTRNLLNESEEFSNFFDGFNFFGQITLYVLVLIAFSIPAFALFFIYIFPFELMGELGNSTGDPQYLVDEIVGSISNIPGFTLSTVILLFIGLMMYIYTSYSLTLVIIADRKMQFWQAMELSRKVVAKKFFSFVALYIILGVLMSIGMVVTCGLGILVAFPYMNTIVFAIYEDVIGPEENLMEKNLEDFGGVSETETT